MNPVLSEIDGKWRELVKSIYSLQDAIDYRLRKYEGLSSKSNIQEELEDYAKTLKAIIKVLDGE